MDMKISTCTKEDFDEIIENFELYWGNEKNERLQKIRTLHHPMMLYELGDNAYVVKDDNKVIAYLFGIISRKEPLAYVHMIATHRDYKRKGYARQLYEHFIEAAKQDGCKYIKAITSIGNEESRRFHTGIGMRLIGETNTQGIPVVSNYAGPGEDRVVIMKSIV
ncbi:MAG: GNAT family N-acetyltransferase [Clostridia bacterium]|nr:GNAT family N-acetyltransferase [Clostridia bacterium]